jgi:hypothetical protein
MTGDHAHELLSHRALPRCCGPFFKTLILGLLVLLSICLAWRLIGFSAMVSDAFEYAKWSHNLAERAGGWHLPGYPFLIALARELTLGLVPDLPLMVAVSFVAWVIGIVFMSRVLAETAPELREIGLLLYGLFPFVGITHVALPLADTLAHTLFLTAFYASQKKWKWTFLASTAMGLIVHMVLWPFLLMLSIVWLIERRLAIWHVVISGVPLALYYGTIAVTSGDWLWFFRLHYAVNFETSVAFPLFNAVIGPIATGSMTGMGKGILVLLVIAATVWLAVFAWNRRNWLILTTALPLLLFAAAVNAQEAFIVVRYARFLVIPFCVWAAVDAGRRTLLTSCRCVWATVLILVVSQWIWAAYTVNYYWDR